MGTILDGTVTKDDKIYLIISDLIEKTNNLKLSWDIKDADNDGVAYCTNIKGTHIKINMFKNDNSTAFLSITVIPCYHLILLNISEVGWICVLRLKIFLI